MSEHVAFLRDGADWADKQIEMPATAAKLRAAADELERLQALEAAVQKYVAFRMGPIDWTVAEEEWQKVVAQASQLAADAEGGE